MDWLPTLRRYRGTIITLSGCLFILIAATLIAQWPDRTFLSHVLNELGIAAVVAGLLTLFIDESARREFLSAITDALKTRLDVEKSHQARAYISGVYGHPISKHVWDHAHSLFEVRLTRHDYNAVFTLTKTVAAINGEMVDAMRVVAEYDFTVKNISSTTVQYSARCKLEANALKAGAESLQRMEYIPKRGTGWTAEQKALAERCIEEREAWEGGDRLYYTWRGDIINLEPEDEVLVRERLEYIRASSDSDIFLASAPTDKLTFTVNHPADVNVLVFHISPQNPIRHRVSSASKSLTLDDVTPYQGFVFFWR
jgi:hypothetical protein